MELELGLKITKTKENLTSTTNDLRIAKDSAGPVFFSRETENMFVLTAHLKGFKRERIQIDISKDRTRITISGSKPVQEMMMKKWIVQKKQVEMKGFSRVFRIPDGVIVDKIKAKFNEKDMIISIFMPKLIIGIQGKNIQEVKQEEEQEEENEQAAAAAAGGEEGETSSSSSKTRTTPPPLLLPPPPPPPPPAAAAAELEQQHQPELTTQRGGSSRDVVREDKLEVPETIEFPAKAAVAADPIKQVTTQPVVEVEAAAAEETNQDDKPLPLPYQMSKNKDEVVEAETIIQQQEAEEEEEEITTKVEPHHREEMLQEEVGGISEAQEEEVQNHETTHAHDDMNLEAAADGQLMKEEIQGDDKTTTDRGEDETEIQQEDRGVETSSEEENDQDEMKYEKERVEEQTPPQAQAQAQAQAQGGRSSSRLCGPCVFAGSAFIGFIIVLVIQLMKKSNKFKKN